MTISLLSFGANRPLDEYDLTSTLKKAISAVADEPEISLVKVSRLYSTPAFPPGSGPDFLNAAASIGTSYQPNQLLAILHRIEQELGRTRTVRWESRVCDIDLLACGDSVVPNHATIAEWMAMSDSAAHQAWPEELLLPHPRLHQRGFVLVPLMDVAPDWHHPVTDQTVAEMVAALPDEAIADIKAKDVYSTA